MHCAYCDMQKNTSQAELTLTVKKKIKPIALAIMELWSYDISYLLVSQ